MAYVSVSGVLDEIESVGNDIVNAQTSVINKALPGSEQIPQFNDGSSSSSLPAQPISPDLTPSGGLSSALPWVAGAVLLGGGAYLLARGGKKPRRNPGRRGRKRRGRRC